MQKISYLYFLKFDQVMTRDMWILFPCN